VKLNLDNFLSNAYGINYKTFELGYCHKYNIPKQITNLHEKYPYINKNIIQETVVTVVRKKYIEKYDREFYRIFKQKLSEKIGIDFNFLNAFYDYSPLDVREVNFEENFIVFEGDINRFGYYITRMYNLIYDTDYSWCNLQRKLLEEANSYLPPSSKKFYKRQDVYWIYSYLLYKWENYFPSGGRNLFQFYPSEIQIHIKITVTDKEIEEYLRATCLETHKDNSELYNSIKEYRIEEEKKKELKKQRLKDNKIRLQKLLQNSKNI